MGDSVKHLLPVEFMLKFLKTITQNNSHRRLFHVTVILSLIYAIINRRRKQRALQANPARGLPLPPGPWGWPILGIMPSLAGGKPHHVLTEMSKTYGPIMSFMMGSFRTVVLSDYDLIKEAFAKSGDKFSDRPKVFMFENIHPAGAGVVLNYYETGNWKDNRRFTLRALRKLGMGKAAMMEDRIIEEAGFVIRSFDQQQGRPFRSCDFTNLAVANMINSLVFGKRADYDDPVFLEVITKMLDLFKHLGVCLFNFIPMMKYLPGSGYWETAKIPKFFEDMWYRPHVMEHVKTFNANHIRDFVDAYLHEHFLKEGSHYHYDDAAAMGAVGDVFGAGLETTSVALDWVIMCLTKYPEVQEKAQRELDEVVGRHRMPQWADRQNLHYVMAMLDEVMRWSAGGPFGVPHSPIEDTEFRGYFIPKGAVVIPNLHAVMHNPDVFPDPGAVKPERFLNSDGKFVKHEHMSQFSVGRRACVGEHLARMEIYTIVTHIIHTFTLRAPNGDTDSIRTEGIMGLSKNPCPYKLCAIRRTDTYDVTEIPMDLLSDDNNNNNTLDSNNNNNEAKHCVH
ncbi:cytochrome P450 2C15-like [Patiria miniata]|uniref:Cytochrome P450 n=1 Tax=Patiria miniata TaxID=46514 RepID=A0A914A528_PATMI|nr:cytochrome P450 2C15-like [Patiria miniata]